MTPDGSTTPFITTTFEATRLRPSAYVSDRTTRLPSPPHQETHQSRQPPQNTWDTTQLPSDRPLRLRTGGQRHRGNAATDSRDASPNGLEAHALPGVSKQNVAKSPDSINALDSDSSGSYMSDDAKILTPDSPQLTGSLGTLATDSAPNIGWLSLDRSGTIPALSASECRGRDHARNAVAVAPKRAASRDLHTDAGRKTPCCRHANLPLPERAAVKTSRRRPSKRHGSAGRVSHPPPYALAATAPVAKDHGCRARIATTRNASQTDSMRTTSSSLQTEPMRLNSMPAPQTCDGAIMAAKERWPDMIHQPQAAPIQLPQLGAEVRGIYSGLAVVEAKCVNIDAYQASHRHPPPSADQWQALIALHRTLLYEHHDFLMATQHPAATPALRALAAKHTMPARMWKHGIHAFLEVLRCHRPHSQEHMLSFIILAYQMTALLYETVPSFTDTWIECLGDLARYRMAIEEDREVHSQWGSVAARWYNKAARRNPDVGRLNHHLGILERPSLRKLCLYDKAQTCVIPFPNARDSRETMCGPIVKDATAIENSSKTPEGAIVTVHALIFKELSKDIFKFRAASAIGKLSELPAEKCGELGPALVIVSVAGLLEHGKSSNAFWRGYRRALQVQALEQKRNPANDFETSSDRAPAPHGSRATHEVGARSETLSSCPQIQCDFYIDCINTAIKRFSTPDTFQHGLSFVHTIMVFLHSLEVMRVRLDEDRDRTQACPMQADLTSVLSRISWGGLSECFNKSVSLLPGDFRMEDFAFQTLPHLVDMSSQGEKGSGGVGDNGRGSCPQPLAEERLMQGLIWTQWALPPAIFAGYGEDEDGRVMHESDETKAMRVKKVLWFAMWFVQHGYLVFGAEGRNFFKSVKADRQDSGFAGSETMSERGESPEAGEADLTTRDEVEASTLSGEDGFTLVDKIDPDADLDMEKKQTRIQKQTTETKLPIKHRSVASPAKRRSRKVDTPSMQRHENVSVKDDVDGIAMDRKHSERAILHSSKESQ